VSVLGGKFTTYRLMAKQVVDSLVRSYRWPADRCLTDQVSLLEVASPVALSHWHDLVRAVEPDGLARLLARYGAGAVHILQRIRQEPSLGRRVCPHHEYLEAELVHAFRQELACTVTDVLARRTRIAWSSCQGLDLLSTVTGVAERHAGMRPGVIARQVEDYHQFLARGCAFRRNSAEHLHSKFSYG
jgi:glycerol-3-phosphate dehydrogenase